MSEVKNGDTVRVHYTGKLDDGLIFDSSVNGNPIEFTVGKGKLIDGFEEAVVGMNAGETRTIKIAPNKAYGEYNNNLVGKVNRDRLPPQTELAIDKRIKLKRKDGKLQSVRVIDLSESSVTLDGNHPLAGQHLVFEIELIEIL
jgi:peptidylprolyl isomerase